MFLGPGPTVGTERGGAVDGGVTEGSVDEDAEDESLMIGKVGWMIGMVGLRS